MAIAALAILAATSAQAEVKLPAIFGDHMVLQEDKKLPIWGWASPGEKVTVTFAGQNASTTAGGDGSWRVELQPVAMSGTGQTLTIAGNNQVSFSDVIVGDVWIASGQSNMELGIQAVDGGPAAAKEANDPQLRLFFVPWGTALDPQHDLPNATKPQDGKWQVCTPEVMSANWAWHGMSAVGYFFARDIRQRTGHPLGLIATYKGGTPAQAWVSIDGMGKDPALYDYVETHQSLVSNLAKATDAFTQKEAAYKAALAKWNQQYGKAPQPGHPRPQEPTPADGGFNAPGNLYNAMVAPLMPYAMKGVIWYQGESNANVLIDAVSYRPLFERLIEDWREKWNQGDFPFLYVELSSYRASKIPAEGNWPWLRDSQRRTLSVPNTAMATAADIGNPTYIHPADKIDVGHRLALTALRVAYGQSDLVDTGPLYRSMSVQGNTARLSFDNVGDGLTLGVPPWTYNGERPKMPTQLTDFLIAGPDKHFVAADATIDGDSVVVSAPNVSQPAAVRYGWSDTPHLTLYNKNGLPASPFRTDDWEAEPLENYAVMPIPGGGDWMAHFKRNLAQAKGNPVDVIFDGDSITDWFQTTGKSVWNTYYVPRSAIDFAIAGDQTSQMLWRLQHGQLDGLDPKLVVLLIGTNNTIRDGSDQIVDGIKACVDEYLQRCPHAHIVLLSIFPRRTLHDPLRVRVNETDRNLEKVAFGDRVSFVDINKIWLDDDQAIHLDLMPGRLHPNLAGYQAWADAMEPMLTRYIEPLRK